MHTNGSKNFKSKTSPKVDLDRKGKITSVLTVLFWEKGPPQRGKHLKSAIQDVINPVNKLSYLPKQEDKECSLRLKFNSCSLVRPRVFL